MKNFFPVLCVLLLIVFTQSLFAQGFPTDKGSKFMTTGAAFSSAGGDYENSDGDRLVTFQLSYSYAFLVSDKFAIGPKFIYVSQSQGDASYSTFGIGAHAFYFLTGNDKSGTVKGKFLPYLGLAFTYQSISAGGFSENATGTIFSFGIGAMYMMTESAALMTEFGYQMDSIESISGNKINLISGIGVFL